MNSNEKDEIESKVADGNEAMVVDGEEVGNKADNSQKMEVDEEMPPVSRDEGLDAERKEDGEKSVEIETGDGRNHRVNTVDGDGGGEAEADCIVDGVPNQSIEGKGANEVHLPNESKDSECQPLKSQMGGPVLADERDGDHDEAKAVAARMEDLAPRVSDKNEAPEKSNDVTEGLKASIQNGTKKEELSHQLTSVNDSKEDELKRELKIPKVEEPKKEVAAVQLVVCDETKREPATQVKENLGKPDLDGATETEARTPPPARLFLGDPDVDGYESGTEEEQREFARELDIFHREKGIDFKPPKFYQEQLNLLKLWRWVIKLGGYEQVTSCKLWRQVGESFRPPKTCTTISWTFRGFYEKTLLEYEKQKILSGHLPEIDSSSKDTMVPGTQGVVGQPSGSGRARRDAASRAMQGWHSLRASNGEVGDPIIKDKQSTSLGKHERQLKNIAMMKRQKQSPTEHTAKVGHLKTIKSQSETMVVDAGPPADWVKINVHRTKDCYEVYVLVPGLLREEVRVQSDPAGRLVISGQPEHPDNPWGVTPFKKVVSLPSRIDSHQTSAVVTLHGQLFVRVPFEQSDN